MGEAHEFEVKRGSSVITYVLSSQGIIRASRYRRRLIKWYQVKTLWKLKNSFLVFFSDTGFWVLPVDQIPNDASGFLLEQIDRVGARVKSLGS